MDAMTRHAAKVARLAEEVRRAAGSGGPLQIVKGGTPHFVPLPGDSRSEGRMVDISAFNEILRVDPEANVCVAEPGVTFADLIRETLRVNRVPTVVPELEGISLGGAIVGCSVEALSYLYGGFHDSCLEYELVTGTGEVVVCSPAEEPLLFHMMHGSYGTLAILTRITFRLVPAAPFVKMTYHKVSDAKTFHDELLTLCHSGRNLLIDAIVHDPDTYVLCLGEFTDRAPYTSNYRLDEIFYKSTLARAEDYLSTQDYAFRYDTECHWLSRTVPPLEWKPVRRLIGRQFLGSNNLIRWTKRLEPFLGMKKRPDVVCDVFIPSARLVEFLDWYRTEFRFFPLWVVPYLMPQMYPWVSEAHAARMMAGMEDGLLIDCAIYGKPNSEPDRDWSEVLERKVYELGGVKTLIGRNHYTEERFWDIYNRPNYEAAKNRLDPHGAFPGLLERLHRVE